MKRFRLVGLALVSLAVGPVKAADLRPAPVYTKAPVMAPVYNWTGFYVGLNGGYSWGRANTDFTILGVTPGSVSQNLNGWLGGGQAGYNWQVGGTWVFGIEADIQATGQKGTFSLATPTICPVATVAPLPCTTGSGSVEQKLPWFGTLRGRLGITPLPTWLLYATGGLAYGEVDTNATFTAAVGPLGGAVTSTTASTNSNSTRVGWTVGAGAEWAIFGPWSVKAEYLYMNLGTLTTNFAGPAPFTLLTTSSRVTDNIGRVGVNYRFGVGG
jgi:outer membrane immunogenic protein